MAVPPTTTAGSWRSQYERHQPNARSEAHASMLLRLTRLGWTSPIPPAPECADDLAGPSRVLR